MIVWPERSKGPSRGGEVDTAPLRCGLFQASSETGAVVCGDRGVKRVFLPSSNAAVARRRVVKHFPRVSFEDTGTGVERALEAYFKGGPIERAWRLDTEGLTSFSRRVFEAVGGITFGTNRSYGWVAARLGLTRGARAVGQALGRNPFLILVPCHRVIMENGRLGGWSGDRGWKERLSAIEGLEVQ